MHASAVKDRGVCALTTPKSCQVSQVIVPGSGKGRGGQTKAERYLRNQELGGTFCHTASKMKVAAAVSLVLILSLGTSGE